MTDDAGYVIPTTDNDPSIAAIEFALSLGDDGEAMDLLRAWHAGNFPEIRAEWPECPDDVFEGADPLFKPKKD